MTGRVRRSIEAVRRLFERYPRQCRLLSEAYRRLYIVAFTLTVLFVIVAQAEINGFIPWHHGFVSSHNLSIITHTTPENRFAGYALSFSENDRIRYEYFRRSPGVLVPPQYALTILPFSTFREQMSASFQFMNIISLLSLWIAFCIMRRLVPSANLAMAVTIFAFSNYYLMRYRDMIAPDNLTLLGLLLVVYGAMDSMTRSRRWVFYLCAVVGSLLGWGVASLPVLCFWCFLRILSIASWARWSPRAWFHELLRLDALWAFLLSIVLVGGAIAYTMMAEADLNGVTTDRTSIADSIERRSDGPSIFHPIKHFDRWMAWGEEQIFRLEKSFYPHTIVNSSHLDRVRVLFFGMLLFIFGAAMKRWNWTQRALAILLATSGVFWLLVLTEHARPHEYSALTFVSVPLVALGSVLVFVPRWIGGIILIPVVVAFGVANTRSNEKKEQQAEPRSWMSEDFQAIEAIVPVGAKIFYDRGYRKVLGRAPYAIGYFLNGRHIIKTQKNADFAISRNRRFKGKNLTPKNSNVFLFTLGRRATNLRPSETNHQKRAPTKGDQRAPTKGDQRAPTKGGQQKRAPTKGGQRAPTKGGQQRRALTKDGVHREASQ